MIAELQRTERLNENFRLAEDRFVYAFLTSPFVRQGMDLSGRPINETAIALGDAPEDEDLDPSEIWRADGGIRRFRTNGWTLSTVYQDADGLLSLNTGRRDLIERWLMASGRSGPESEELAAKLDDYRDSDQDRQFRGGERADYRMLQRTPPTDSFLRTFEELGNVLSWESAYTMLDWQAISELSLFVSGSVPRLEVMPQRLQTHLNLSDDAETFLDLDDLNDAQLVLYGYPSPRAQIILAATENGEDKVYVRVIEVERTTSSPDRAYTRRLVWEDMAQSDELSDTIPSYASMDEEE